MHPATVLTLIGAAAGTFASFVFWRKKPAKVDPDLLGDYDADRPDQRPPLLGSAGIPHGDGFVGKPVLALMNTAAKNYILGPKGKPFWTDPKSGKTIYYKPAFSLLTNLDQVTAFKLALAQLEGPDRSVPWVVTRDVLAKMFPAYDWIGYDAADLETFDTAGADEGEALRSVYYLVNAAAAQLGLPFGGKDAMKGLLGPVGPWPTKFPYKGSNGLLIGRRFLELPEPFEIGGSAGLKVGQRVELLVGDYAKTDLPYKVPKFFHAEPVIAKVISIDAQKAPRVEVVGAFQGVDVTPRFLYWHTVGVGKQFQLYGPSSPTTGIRRVFGSGVV